jgi:hypothetical protein
MGKRKPPSMSKKTLEPVVAFAIARQDVSAPPEPPPAPPLVELAPEPEPELPIDLGDIDHLPSPAQIVRGEADAPEPPPGRAPRGDCRSMQRVRTGAPSYFALVYRHETALITRAGLVGLRGDWRVLQYPTSAAAARAYAQECARLADDGYCDVR